VYRIHSSHNFINKISSVATVLALILKQPIHRCVSVVHSKLDYM